MRKMFMGPQQYTQLRAAGAFRVHARRYPRMVFDLAPHAAAQNKVGWTRDPCDGSLRPVGSGRAALVLNHHRFALPRGLLQ